MPDIIYLDNAATTFPKPESVIMATVDCMKNYCGNPGRGSHPIALKSAEKVFDGTPLTSGHCDVVDGSVAPGETLRYESTGTQTLAGQSVNYISVSILDKDGNDTSNQYEILYRAGTLTVTPRKISIRSADATKPWDGKPLSSSGWELLAGQLCEGHEINVKTYGVQTSVGECDNEIVHVAIFDTSGGNRVDVTNSYQIECYYGTLTVTMP